MQHTVLEHRRSPSIGLTLLAIYHANLHHNAFLGVRIRANNANAYLRMLLLENQKVVRKLLVRDLKNIDVGILVLQVGEHHLLKGATRGAAQLNVEPIVALDGHIVEKGKRIR